jgi:hypothetical protein
MTSEMITMLVRVPQWTQAEIVAVARSPRLATWREVDRVGRVGPADVSFDVAVSTQAAARPVVREVLGPLAPDAFLAST